MHSSSRVVVLTVTYGKRWNFLSQVVEEVMQDDHVKHLVIVDNGSKNEEAIKEGVAKYKDRVHIIRNEKNLGSAGGYALGLSYVRSLECDFVFLLDDDTVPEKDAIATFLHIREKIGDKQIVLVGNRTHIPGNEALFYRQYPTSSATSGTFFEIFSLRKVKHFFGLLFMQHHDTRKVLSVAHLYVPNESFVYGGAFIPIEAIRRAPLPDKDLILYGDDIEYSWGIKRLGYSSYVCYSPKIFDIEMSFGEASQVTGLFSPATAFFKVYYRIRNMVRISRRNTTQFGVVLLSNIIVWILGLFILGLCRYGISKDFLKRVRLILQAVYAGYYTHYPTPPEALLP